MATTLTYNPADNVAPTFIMSMLLTLFSFKHAHTSCIPPAIETLLVHSYSVFFCYQEEVFGQSWKCLMNPSRSVKIKELPLPPNVQSFDMQTILQVFIQTLTQQQITD